MRFLHDLEQHWTDIKSIGRSEDMVDIQQAKVIDLVENWKYFGDK